MSETVKKNDVIKVDYVGTLEDGTVFDTSKKGENPQPLEFKVGEGKVIKGFDQAVEGMAIGEEKEIKINPEEGYGQRNEEYVKEFPRKQLPKDQEPKPGMMLMLNGPQGQQFPAVIAEVNEETVKIDLNHPLAGKVLNFKITLVSIN